VGECVSFCRHLQC